MNPNSSVRLVLCALAGLSLATSNVMAARQALSTHVLPATASAAAVGQLPPTKQLRLAIGLPLRNEAQLERLLADLYDPASPQFHQYVTPEEFTREFGPSEADYEAVVAFARAHGLTVTATHPNRMLLDVTGTVGAIESTFHVVLRTYRHPREDRTFYAPDAEPTMDLAVPVLHVSGLDDFVLPHPADLHVRPLPLDTGSIPLSGSGPGGSYFGGDFRSAYARTVTLTGAGQVVGLLQFEGYDPNDIASYESQAGIAPIPLQNVFVDDFNGTSGTNNGEVCLDIEMAAAMAPGLSAIVVYSAGPGGIGNDILNRMATDNLAKQLSSSWSFGTDSTTAQIFRQMVAQGQAFFEASGDSGAFTGSIPGPGDDPNITSVGGTTLSTTGPLGVWTSETAWNWASIGRPGVATGGGVSTSQAVPTYQKGMNFSSNGGSASHRNIPDVAMVADNVYVTYNSGQSGGFGGTSVSSPLWAGFTALINQQAALLGKPPVGFLNPAVYALGKGAGYSTNFHDTVTGNNTNSSSPTLFFAVSGYDLCTGWGTPQGLNLINSLAPRSNAPVIIAAGATLVSEGCLPANGAVDPGETVTMNLALQNIGAVRTTSLVATLQADSGIIAPNAPVSYGALAVAGAAVTRGFSFTAAGSCGGNLTATLQLQDGASNLGNVTFSIPLGKPVIVLTQNFDSVTAPALPSGWTTAFSGTGTNWVTSTLARDSKPNAAFVGEPALPGISELLSPAIPISTASAQLSFRHSYNLEAVGTNAAMAYDGGVLEIQLGSGAFADILAAGGSFVTNGYNKTIDPTDDNPFDGRQVWSGVTPGFITTVVNLPAAAAGQTVHFKWRSGTDSGNAGGASGWFIDNISVRDGTVCCNSIADLISGQSASPAPALLGQPLTYTIGTLNSGPEPGYKVTVTDVLPPTVTFSDATPGYVFTNNTVVYNLGTLASNGVGTISVTVIPTTGDPVTNTVVISSVTSDPNLLNNTNTLVTEVSTNVPPTISVQPIDVATLVTSNATFQVSAGGNPPPEYQWWFNGTQLPDATNSVLSLTNVQPAQMGGYSVVLTNDAGSVTSLVAHLTVLVPPVLHLASFGANGTNVFISVDSVTGLNYTLEYKDSLGDPAWTPLLPAQPGTGGALLLQDTNAVAPARFYRVNTH